jgi:hypothetical protein
LLHDRAIACRAKEDKARPACGVPECEGRYAIRLNELLKDIYGEKSRVHLVQGYDGWENPEGAWMVEGVEEEDEAVLMNTVQQEGGNWRELDDLWLELNRGECGEVGGVYCVGACLRECGSASGAEGEQPHETLYLSEEEGAVEASWWSPDPMDLQPDEGDKEYLISLLMGGSSAGRGEPEPARTPASSVQSHQTDGEGAAEEGNYSRGEIQRDKSPPKREPKEGPPRRQGAREEKAPKEKPPVGGTGAWPGDTCAGDQRGAIEGEASTGSGTEEANAEDT